MSGYAKLFSSIIHSTIWREPDHIRLVWITMLALSNKDGVVEASVPGLADASRVSIEQCEDALRKLSLPDKYSRSQEYEGRRISIVPGGWLLLNYVKYRGKLINEKIKEQNKARQQRFRERQKETILPTMTDIETHNTHAGYFDSVTVTRNANITPNNAHTDTDPYTDNTNYIVSNNIVGSNNHNSLADYEQINTEMSENEHKNNIQSSDSQKFELMIDDKSISIKSPPPKDFTKRQTNFLNMLKNTEFYIRGKGVMFVFHALKDPVGFAKRIGDSESYPLVEPSEIKRIGNWTIDNRKKSKKAPLNRFILNWLERAQQNGCRNNIGSKQRQHQNQQWHPSFKVFEEEKEEKQEKTELSDDIKEQLKRIKNAK